MRCHEVKKSLSGYLDGACSERVAIDLGLHLEQCARCRKELEVLAEAKRFAAWLGEVDPPGDLWFEIKRKLPAREKSPRVWFSRPLLRAAVISAVALLFVLVIPMIVRFFNERGKVPIELYTRLYASAHVRADSGVLARDPLVTEIREISKEEAVSLADFFLSLPDQLPGDYARTRIRLIRLGERNLFQIVYSNGQDVLCLFEQSSRYPIDFGDLDVQENIMGRQICKKCSPQSCHLLTWKHGPAHLTLITRQKEKLEITAQYLQTWDPKK